MQSTQLDVKEYSYFAGNQWRKAADNQLFESCSPASRQELARMRTAVDAAAKAFAG